MKLQDWLARKGLTQQAFATQVGVSQQLVNRWVGGHHAPRIKTIILIEKVTKGAVKMRDFVK